MEKNIIIRNEKKEDWEVVETLTRQAFYNIYVPGCGEHYLVHIMREHEDFIPELDFVLELNGDVIGNIMYTKAKLIDENGISKDILTFGPVSILHRKREIPCCDAGKRTDSACIGRSHMVLSG